MQLSRKIYNEDLLVIKNVIPLTFPLVKWLSDLGGGDYNPLSDSPPMHLLWGTPIGFNVVTASWSQHF